MSTSLTTTIVIAGILGLILICGCASRGRPLRPTSGCSGNPPATVAKPDAWYLESVPAPGEKPISCSFVEFDERGDYLDFQQHRHAYEKIKELSKAGERLLVITYVHGWKNNSQSGDVVEFNSFLHQIASSPMVREGHFRVYGIYLGWRGNAVLHSLDYASEYFADTEKAYGSDIVNPKYARKPPFGWLLWAPEQLSYWKRKGAAENKVSRVSIIRTIFSCAYAAKRYNTNSTVFLMGHSLGALMLEQAFAPATLSVLTEQWPWDNKDLVKEAEANPLPFDLVMLVNSAAPSIYAKQLHDYMVAHRSALQRDGVTGADAPIIISLTSTGDWATGIIHPIANCLAPLYPSLWRNYDGRDFILRIPPDKPTIEVPQSYYYRHTPGHNPLLVNHWIVPAKTAPEPDGEENLLHKNMNTNRVHDINNRTFETSPRKTGGKHGVWQVTTESPDKTWSSYHGYEPCFLGTNAIKSGYWIMRCPPEIIKDHNDVWSKQAMETYVALFRETQHLRKQPPDPCRWFNKLPQGTQAK